MEGLSRFSGNLYHKFDDEDNVFFSGYSISSAIALAYLGAKGETARQIAEVMGYKSDAPELVKILNELGLSLNTDDGKVKTMVGNSLWVQDDLNLSDGFLKIASGVSELVRRVDYINAPETARKQINEWVGDKTRDMIRDLIPDKVINKLTRLIIANAIYFNGKWYKSFDPEFTEDAPFYNLDGSTSNVKLMYNWEVECLYKELPNCQFAALSYGDMSSDACMLVVLPKEGCFNEVNNTILPTSLRGMLNGSSPEKKVILWFPKFKLRYKKDLAGILSADMPIAFSNDADFSGITGQRDLTISNIIHEAVVDVTEEGTEAAAATALILRACSASLSTKPPVIIRVDRPFIFAIWDKKNDVPMFMGKVTKL